MVSNLKYVDVFKDPKWLLDNLFPKWKVIRVPTNAGWSSSNAGSGGVSQVPFYLTVYTGTTASSRGMTRATVYGLNSGNIHHSYIDWTKRIEISFTLSRTNSDPEAVARFQLKESNAEGALAQRGVGVTISNFNMVGEGYGTARSTVPIGTLTDSRMACVKIVKTDTELQFWVNNELKGTLTGAYVPNVSGTTTGYLLASIINGTTGGVNAQLFISNIQIAQEW